MNVLQKLETSFLKREVPNLNIGQTVRVSLNIVEGDKERIQVYEGVVIGKRGTGHREMITVRKVSYSVGVERVFPLHSPLIQQIKVVREGKVNRAKLYYLRERTGRAGRLAEKDREIQKGVPPVSDPSTNVVPKDTAVSELSSVPVTDVQEQAVAVS